MAQPTQLTPTEQDALVKQIGLAMLRVAPDDWEQLTVDYRAVGRYSEATGKVVYTDGGTDPWTMPPDLQALFARLRGGMYREGRGTWFNARYKLDHPSSYNLEYDREEPSWDLAPPPQAYPDDMRMFPRSEDNVPSWLRRRLSSAPPPPPSPRFRVARIFDGPGAMVNRPPVPPNDVRDLLGYLDNAPLTGPARGYDVDRMDPEGRQSVPVAFHTDGTWIWPAAVNYYLREHDVPPEPELVDHIARLRFEIPLIDDSARSAAAAFLGPPGPGGPGGPGPGGLGGPGPGLAVGGPGGPGGPPGPPPRPAPGPTRAMPAVGPGPGHGGPGPGGPGGPPGPPPMPPPAPPPVPVVPSEPVGSAPAAALPSQGPPAKTVDELRARLSDLGVPDSAFRIGRPTGRAWTMEQTEEGWRVGWYDRAFVAPAMFEDVADASAFLLGKLMMDGGRGVSGPVHVVPAQPPMIGDRLGTEDADKNALNFDEPVRPSEELDVPEPGYGAGAPGYGQPAGHAADAGYGAPEGGYGAPNGGYGPPAGDRGHAAPDAGYGVPVGNAAPDSGFGAADADYSEPKAPDPGFVPAGSALHGGGFGPDGGPDGYGAADGFGPGSGGTADSFGPGSGGFGSPGGYGAPDLPVAEPAPPTYGPPGGTLPDAEPESGRHGRHGRHDADRPNNGQPDSGRNLFGQPDDGYGRPGRPGGQPDSPDPLGSRHAGVDPEKTQFAPAVGLSDVDGPDSPRLDSPPAGFERPGVVRPDSPRSLFGGPDLEPARLDSPRSGFERPDLARADSPRADLDSPRAGFERPDLTGPESPRGGFERPSDLTRPVSPRSGLDSPRAGFERPDLAGPESPHGGFRQPDLARPDSPRADLPRPDSPRAEHAGGVAQSDRPAAAPVSGDWPISPLPGEPPLTLFRGKRLMELEPGTEIDRFGDDDGNLVYAVGTPFKERSLVPEWVDRPYHAYRVRQPVQVLTGSAIPWFDQPGGGTAYLLPDAVSELVAMGRLVEVIATKPPA